MRLQWSSLTCVGTICHQPSHVPATASICGDNLPLVRTPDPSPCMAKLRPKVLRLGTRVNLHTKLAPRMVLVKEAASKMYACMSTGSAGAKQLLLGERFTQAQEVHVMREMSRGAHWIAPPSTSLSRRLVSSSARRYSAAAALFNANCRCSTSLTTSSDEPPPPSVCSSSENLQRKASTVKAKLKLQSVWRV